MRKILLALIVIFIILSPAAVTAQFIASEVDPPDLDDSAYYSRASSRALTVPPVQMQQAIGDIVDQVSEEHLKTFLTKLVGFGSRLYRAPGMYNASLWLHDVLAGNGRLKTEYHNFSVTTTHGTFTLSNVILTLPGLNTSSDQIYYMFAHSDAVQMTDPNQWLTNTPGADDDGSGCVAALEAARVLSRYDFHDTIKFAFFQAEEIGLVGSARYAQTMAARNENVPASIDYDMIGYTNNPNGNDLEFWYSPANKGQATYMEGVNNRYDIDLDITFVERTGTIPSDIMSFYNRGFPCVMGIEHDNNPYYHTIQDTVNTINFGLVSKSTRLAVASLSEWARLLYVDVSIPPGNLTVSDNQPDEDDSVTINVTVNNTGNLAAHDLEVVFYADSEPFATNLISVPVNGTNTTTAYWTATEGRHNITVALDPKNEIVETDETNNTAWVNVNVNDRPRAVLTAIPMTAYTNETIIFNGSNSWDYVGGVTEYNFNFGDGNTTGWNASYSAQHSYPEDGFYTASLLVRDPDGAVSKQVNLTIKVLNRAPSAQPYSNLTRTFTFVPIQFVANATDFDGIVTTYWNFADGVETAEENPVHNYSKSGSYDVVLTIQDDDGASESYKLNIIIDNRPPVCEINASALSGNINTRFVFEAEAYDIDGTIADYKWYMGDGTTDNWFSMEHRYKSPGVYFVRLVVYDDEGAATETMINITVIDTPPVAVAEAMFYEVRTFDTAYFVGEDSYDLEGAITYAWDFGDGNTSSEMSPQHIYWEPGNYSVSLTVQDSAGNFDTVDLTPITVLNRPPTADFWYFGNFTENGIIYFDGSNSSDPEGPVSYLWKFEDGTTYSEPLVSHIFPAPGKFRVELIVTDAEGEFDFIEYTVKVNANPPPEKIKEQITKEEEPDDNSFMITTAMIITNILWIVILAAVAIWAMKRKPKEKDATELQPSEYQAAPPDFPPYDSSGVFINQQPPQAIPPDQEGVGYPQDQTAPAFPAPAPAPEGGVSTGYPEAQVAQALPPTPQAPYVYPETLPPEAPTGPAVYDSQVTYPEAQPIPEPPPPTQPQELKRSPE